MNYSRQREIILNILFESKAHPTAEDILAEVRKVVDKVARGTVYRNLSQLVECGDIIKITTPEGTCRYDYIHRTHCHAVCERCGRVFDFFPKSTGLFKEELECLGFSAGESSLTVTGVCKQCKICNNV